MIAKVNNMKIWTLLPIMNFRICCSDLLLCFVPTDITPPYRICFSFTFQNLYFVYVYLFNTHIQTTITFIFTVTVSSEWLFWRRPLKNLLQPAVDARQKDLVPMFCEVYSIWQKYFLVVISQFKIINASSKSTP